MFSSTEKRQSPHNVNRYVSGVFAELNNLKGNVLEVGEMNNITSPLKCLSGLNVIHYDDCDLGLFL